MKKYSLYSAEKMGREKKKQWHFAGFVTKEQWNNLPKEWKKEGTIKLGKVI